MQEGEAGFAASNSSLLVFDRSHVWIGLGGASGASSVLTSTDAGKTWKRVSIEEIPSGPTSGIFSIARNAEGTAIAVGGDFKLPERDEGNVAIYDPKTNRWRAPKFSRPRGYRSSVLAIDPPIDQSKAVSKLGVSEPDDAKWGPTRWIAAGPTGCDWSSDGERWYPLSDTPFHALSISKDGIVWASGGQGRVGFHPRRR